MNFTPRNPQGRIVLLKTEENCAIAFKGLDLEAISRGLGDNNSIFSYLPFYVDLNQVDTL